MRVRFELPYGGVTIPPEASNAFVPCGEYRPIPTGAQWARAQSSLFVLVENSGATVQVRPAIEFNMSEDGTPTQTALGAVMDDNGLYHPTGATDISSNSAQYLVWRPGWMLSNDDETILAHAWVGGYIEVWGAP